MNPLTRRQLLGHALKSAVAASLLGGARTASAGEPAATGALGPHFPGKAKQVIYLHMVGGPSQMDLFDYKPTMKDWYDKDFPESIRKGQRLSTMTSGQPRFPIAPSKFAFAQHGRSGMWISEVLPNLARHADELCLVRSMFTEEINHEPAITHMMTGSPIPGRPSLGAWISHGLGSLNPNLPGYVVMVATARDPKDGQAISARLWSSGFLPGEHAGVPFRSVGDPILYVNDPPGVSPLTRRAMLAGLKELNELEFARLHDPDIRTRTAQYEMANRMQASVPELIAIDREPESVTSLYGPDVKNPGTFAYSALMARRLVEHGVRFVQIYLNHWDHHRSLGTRMHGQCREIDQPCAGLIEDLKQRGLLDSTLIVWGGEFGRTIYSQGTLSRNDYARDHHPRCFSMWMCGGGAKGGVVHGETDEFSYNIVKDPVHVRDLHATVLHLLGFDHRRLSYKFQGLDMRLTGVEPARVIETLLG
jgi:hypothetical protein